MIKIGFDVETDEGVCPPSAHEVTEALSQAIPKEWWADYREDNWGIAVMYPLNDDGSVRQADSRLRPVDKDKKIAKLDALLAQERRLTKHLDDVVYRKVQSNQTLAEEIDRLNRIIRDGKAGNAEMTTRIGDLQERIAFLKQKLAEAEEQYSTVDVDDLFNTIGDLGTELEHQRELVAEWKRRFNERDTEVVKRNGRIDRLGKEIQDLVAEANEWKRKVDARNKAIEDQADAIDNLQEKNDNQFEIIKQFQDDMELLSATVDKKNRRIENLRRRLVEAYGDVEGWGNDEQLTRLETAYEQAKGYVQSANGETDTALAYLDDLGALLDEVRTER
jgi:chromosome segregation ATPase